MTATPSTDPPTTDTPHSIPRGHEAWLQTARAVAAELATDALQRDRANRPAFAEVDTLRRAGLLNLLVPTELGGQGANWRTALHVTREIAAGDGSIGQLIGYHYQISQNAAFFGNTHLLSRLQYEGAKHGWFWGGAFNPRDAELLLTPDADGFLLDGRKSFSTGALLADRLGASALRSDTGAPVFLVLDPDQPGVRRNDDWDNLGQRLSASGSVEFERVPIAADQVVASLEPEDLTPFGTLVTPAIQLVFVQLYLGITEGALATARDYTREHTRPWLLSGVEAATDDPYITATYGDLVARTKAARALADETVESFVGVYESGTDLTWDERGEIAEQVAAAKIVATQTSLDVTARIFEVTGARATASHVGLDRFWRDVRTHTLHDPVAYKQREVGANFLTGADPPFTLYT